MRVWSGCDDLWVYVRCQSGVDLTTECAAGPGHSLRRTVARSHSVTVPQSHDHSDETANDVKVSTDRLRGPVTGHPQPEGVQPLR